MPGRKGRAWGNALGGYRKQPRIGGRFASKGTPGAKINNKTRNRAIRRKIYKRTAIAASAAAVVGAGIYAHKSGLDKRIVKSPQVRTTMKYTKTASSVLGRSVMSTRITQVGPNRYTVQRGLDTAAELRKALKTTRKLHKRAARVDAFKPKHTVEPWFGSAPQKRISNLAEQAQRRINAGQSRRTLTPAPSKEELWKQWERHVEGEKARRKASVNKLGYYRD